MFDLISNNPLIQTMDKSMTLATRRMSLIASNLANIDTPGYRTRDFSFESALRQALGTQNGHTLPMSTTHGRHLAPKVEAALPPPEESIRPAYERNDGNDVSLDRESVLLSRTQTSYQLAASFTQVEIRRIYQLIRDSNR